MKEFAKDENLTCIYCGESQDNAKAIDFIPSVPNLFGKLGVPQYQHSVQDEKCCECDQMFYLRLNEQDKIVAANLPDKCY